MKDMQVVNDISSEELKARVTAEVMAELEKAGATIVKSNYDGFAELSKALNKFDNHVKKYNDEVARIRQRYSSEVALQKIHELDMDLSGEKSWTNIELNSIVEKEQKYKKEAIANNLKSLEYKDARREALDILIPFGDKLDAETTLEFIKPCIEAKDLGILKALKETSNDKTRYLYSSAIDKIEQYLSTAHLEMCIRDARNYVNNPKQRKSIVLESGIYKYSKKNN